MGIFLFMLIPWVISYLGTWMFANDYNSTNRILYTAFISWFIIFIIMTVMWIYNGIIYDSITSIITVSILLSLFNGILSGILGNCLIKNFNKINPE